jgi:hypothetical protein
MAQLGRVQESAPLFQNSLTGAGPERNCLAKAVLFSAGGAGSRNWDGRVRTHGVAYCGPAPEALSSGVGHHIPTGAALTAKSSANVTAATIRNTQGPKNRLLNGIIISSVVRQRCGAGGAASGPGEALDSRNRHPGSIYSSEREASL